MPAESVVVNEAVPWLLWTALGIMIVLQLIILVVIAGRPSAIAVIGVTLPALCGLCGLGATWLILEYIRRSSLSGSSELEDHTGHLIGLIYVIWVICGVVALTAVVMSIVMLRRGSVLVARSGITAPQGDPSEGKRETDETDEKPITRAV